MAVAELILKGLGLDGPARTSFSLGWRAGSSRLAESPLSVEVLGELARCVDVVTASVVDRRDDQALRRDTRTGRDIDASNELPQ